MSEKDMPETPYSSLREATIESVVFDLELEDFESVTSRGEENHYEPLKYITNQSSLVNKKFHDHYFVSVMSKSIREDILAELHAESKRNPPSS